MTELGRRTLTSEERRDAEEIEKSFHVLGNAKNMDRFLEKLATGRLPELDIAAAGPANVTTGSNESSGFSLFDLENISQGMPKTASDEMYEPTANTDWMKASTEGTDESTKISFNQTRALQKYPALIEMLGKEGIGEEIAKEIMAKRNSYLVESLQKNAQSVSVYAKVCKAEKQNIKQYFAGQKDENTQWGCIVTAQGPFRGDEAICFDPGAESSRIVRTSSDEDVTSRFNVIHEYGERLVEAGETVEETENNI